MEKQTLFTETVKASNCIYFFDLKEAKNGKPYLCITSSEKKEEGDYEKKRVFIFEEDFNSFSSAVANAMDAYAKKTEAAA
jgi:hypothetical protein